MSVMPCYYSYHQWQSNPKSTIRKSWTKCLPWLSTSPRHSLQPSSIWIKWSTSSKPRKRKRKALLEQPGPITQSLGSHWPNTKRKCSKSKIVWPLLPAPIDHGKSTRSSSRRLPKRSFTSLSPTTGQERHSSSTLWRKRVSVCHLTSQLLQLHTWRRATPAAMYHLF